jgi:hypothetical protein
MFRDVPGYPGYKINESGIVVNKKGHVMRNALSNTGYLRYALIPPEGDGKHRDNVSMHRLVASAFIPNPDNLPVVMHIDNDKLNNHVSNLKWGTQSDNIRQAFDEGRKVSPRTSKSSKYQIYNDDGEYITCQTRTNLADTIQYAEISLKNMVGNDHIIDQGPYKGYKIRRVKRMYKLI